MSTITQREAHRLKKKVAELEGILSHQRNRWCSTWPSGVSLGYIMRSQDWLQGRIQAARMLGHAVVVTDDGDKLQFYACEIQKAVGR